MRLSVAIMLLLPFQAVEPVEIRSVVVAKQRTAYVASYLYESPVTRARWTGSLDPPAGTEEEAISETSQRFLFGWTDRVVKVADGRATELRRKWTKFKVSEGEDPEQLVDKPRPKKTQRFAALEGALVLVDAKRMPIDEPHPLGLIRPDFTLAELTTGGDVEVGDSWMGDGLGLLELLAEQSPFNMKAARERYRDVFAKAALVDGSVLTVTLDRMEENDGEPIAILTLVLVAEGVGEWGKKAAIGSGTTGELIVSTRRSGFAASVTGTAHWDLERRSLRELDVVGELTTGITNCVMVRSGKSFDDPPGALESDEFDRVQSVERVGLKLRVRPRD